MRIGENVENEIFDCHCDKKGSFSLLASKHNIIVFFSNNIETCRQRKNDVYIRNSNNNIIIITTLKKYISNYALSILYVKT